VYHKPYYVHNNIVKIILIIQSEYLIGRLDKTSEAIFMTNDSDIVNKILRARNNHENMRAKQTLHRSFL
jgi:23S rRNA pseudouridine2604 synthase